MAAKTTEQFITAAIAKHGEKYTYAQTVYTKAQSNVVITCPTHGEFTQRASDHLSGAGCKQCAVTSRKHTNLQRYGVESPLQNAEIKAKSLATSLDRYGTYYPMQSPELQHKLVSTMIERYGVARPLQHAEFRQKYQQTCIDRHQSNHHSRSHAIQSFELLSDYDWLFDQYINLNKTAVAIADDLKIADTTVASYLRYHEIAIKQSYWHSYKCAQWLKHVGVTSQIELLCYDNGGEFTIPGTKLRVDGYDPTSNTVYEFHGDYWHGNPAVYDPHVVNEVAGKTMGQLYQATIDRENRIAELGYTVVVMWERDWDNNNKGN